MPLPRKKKEEAEKEPEREPLLELTEEEQNVITWRIEVLTKEGRFEPWWAGRLALIGDLDWREAVSLRRAGCSQPLVYELLR